MSRLTLIAVASVLAFAPAVAPAFAQTAPAAVVTADPAPQGTDEEQDPAELAATSRLNQEIAARNAAAAQAEADSQASYDKANAAWSAESSRLATQRAQWEADTAAANAARAQYERDQAAWEAEVAACERSGRLCVKTPG